MSPNFNTIACITNKWEQILLGVVYFVYLWKKNFVVGNCISEITWASKGQVPFCHAQHIQFNLYDIILES